MARTVLAYVPAALLLAWSWLRLEYPRVSFWQAVWIVTLALVPALVRSWRARLALGVLAFVAAAHSAFGLSPFDARPFSEHDYFGPLVSRFTNGFLDFYDVQLPFDRYEQARMHGVLLLAVFASCLLLALALAARRTLVAVVVVLVGAGWPSTLLLGQDDLRRGALLLACVLFLFVALDETPRRRLPLAVALGSAVVLAAVAASTSGAVAKGAFLNWQSWDFYTRQQTPVGVQYVWNSDYRGIRFPKKSTTVLRIKAGPESVYWRATTLDRFAGDRWIEDLEPFTTGRTYEEDGALLPRDARDRTQWLRQEVTVAALRDSHLIGASVPVEYDAGNTGSADYTSDGVATVAGGIARGSRYTVWSYAPEPTPAQLASSRADYRAFPALRRELEVGPGAAVPPFGTGRREAAMRRFFAAPQHSAMKPYLPLYRTARAQVGDAASPYAAAVALEAWFRSGGFQYDEHPRAAPNTPPLVGFVTETRQGYCQHFAGAMALMLRYLGIPARVAAGFTSGSYDGGHGEWIVSDRQAHTWVEVWFRRYGWLPFDPTPGRGSLAAPYSAASQSFDVAQAQAALFARAPDQKFSKKDLGRISLGRKLPSLPLAASHGAAPRRSHSSGHALLWVGLVLLGAVAAFVVAKSALRRARYLGRDPRRTGSACRRELVDLLRDQRFDVPRSASLSELAALVQAELGVYAGHFAAAASAARFGAPGEAEAAARRARRELRTLRRQIRRRLTPFERLRGLVSLRSLAPVTS